MTLKFENGVPTGATALVVSTQHTKALSNDAGQKQLRDYVMTVFEEVLPQGWMPADQSQIYVNPTGMFEIGGPDGDAGLTGRKIIVDTYGGASPHGGGAFSGKDPTKVDRSAAYIWDALTAARNARLKFDRSLKPQSSAISTTFALSSRSRSAAARKRARNRY